MANNIIKRTWKQGGLVNIEDLRGSAFQAESGGHTFVITGVDENGDALALSGTPAGVLLRADGQDVTLTCSVSDGAVYATLPANAYVVPGRIGITIFLTNGGQKTAIYAAIAAVATTSSGTVAPPAGADVVDLVNAIQDAIALIPASDANLKAAMAPTYSTSAVYAVGSYAWYDGKLYRCTTAITSGETWTSAHWTQANLGSDVNDLKSAITHKADRSETGFNIWDEEWIAGYYDRTTGNPYTYNVNNSILGVNPIHVVPGEKIYLGTTKNLNVIYCDENLNRLDGKIEYGGYEFTIPENCYYIKVSVNSYTPPYNNDVCINISQPDTDITPHNGEYVKYGEVSQIYNDVLKNKGEIKKLVEADYVQKDGVGQVHPLNIENMVATSGTSLSRNLFSTATLYGTGKYVTIFNNKAVLSNNASYDTYYVPVDGGNYVFTDYRTAVVTLSDKLTVVGSLHEYGAEIDTTGGAYVIFSFNPTSSPATSYEVNKKLSNYEIPPNWVIPERQLSPVQKRLYGKGFATVKGNMASGDTFTISGTNVKKNNIYSFNAHITSFSSVLIGHGKNTYSGSWVEITGTNLIIHNYGSNDTTETIAHGLTIAEYLYVQIVVGVSNKATITIFSNGDVFTVSDKYWNGDANGNTFAESVSSAFTDVVFTWNCADFRKSVWVFGDSYLSMNDANRWAYYLVENGYADNVLLNAYGGESSSQAVTSLHNMLDNYGLPRFIVWCMGMNDGSDANSTTPSTVWTNGINALLTTCSSNDIIPILATIPTVPNINHEGKCNYVRGSGYRYIDFAKAVGAQSNGTWYTGMLSTDNVHPLALGAKALYYQAIADCPELTFENP